MRLVIAASLAVLLAATVVVPHVHLAPTGDECAACVVRGGQVAESQVPDVLPLPLALGQVQAALSSVPRDGAPLGAVSGQSPPRA